MRWLVILFVLSVAIAGCGGDCLTSDCARDCASGQESCNGKCVDLFADEENCGKCGTTCDVGDVCSRGACKAL